MNHKGLELLRRLGVDELDGRYLAQAPIGQSFGGAAFKGIDKKTGHPIFMKYLVYSRGNHERAKFRLEAQALDELTRLPHRVSPRLLHFTEAIDIDVLALVLEWLDGEMLTQYLARASMIPIEERLETFHRIVRAASVATVQYQHRDIHPGNIMLEPPDRARFGPEVTEDEIYAAVKILDWGEALPHIFAQYEDEPNHHYVLHERAPVTIPGSFTSLPPEVFTPWRVARGIGGAYESWGLGLLFYTLMLGEPPIKHQGLGEYIEAIHTGKLQARILSAYQDLCGLNLPGGRILPRMWMRMMSIAPESRYDLSRVGRVLWDVRYENLALEDCFELNTYMADPNGYVPAEGWRFSSIPDFD